MGGCLLLGFVSWGCGGGEEVVGFTWTRKRGPLTLGLKVLSKAASVACSRSAMGIMPAGWGVVSSGMVMKGVLGDGMYHWA